MFWQTNADIFSRQTAPDDLYLRKAHAFMKSWLDGESEFTLQTSGSTGVPKLITVSRSQLVSSARMTGEALSLQSGTRALVCLNISYVAGVMMLVRGMELGWELTIGEPSSNPLSMLPKHRLVYDFIAMVPMQLDACLSNPGTKSRLSDIGKILLGGAPVSVALHEQIRKLPVPVYQSYGMTETVSHVALRRLNGLEEAEDYKVLPGLGFGLDERGCLYFIGAVTNNEKVQTNDLADIQSPGAFRWLGRADNVINSGGVKIILEKVDRIIEQVFLKLGHTTPFFSWYEPDEKLGQKLILIIEGDEGDFDCIQLFEEIRRQVQAYESPKHIYFASQFEKTATDKIDKRGTAKLLLKH
jgi:o-succinylbenzoate---CoA ligase